MKSKNKYGLTSLTLGIIGILFYITLFLGISYDIIFLPNLLYSIIMLIIVPIGILSIIFGALQIKNKKGKTGLILGIVTLVLVFGSMIISALKYT